MISEFSNLTVTQDPPAISIEKVISSVGQNRTKCAYCDELCPSDVIDEHQENCERRKVFCEACGEMIIIDILDYHLENCTHKAGGVHGIYEDYRNYQDDGGQYLLEVDDGNQDAYDNPENQEEDDANQDYLEEGEDDTDVMESYNQNGMTYEQLIALDENIVKKGITPEELESYPVTTHSKESDSPGDCNVCISEFEDGEALRRLSCGHKFHKDCVDTWLETNITCPVCKKYLR